MSRECDGCGLSAADLPDGVDSEVFFERVDGAMLCQSCQQLSPSERLSAWGRRWGLMTPPALVLRSR